MRYSNTTKEIAWFLLTSANLSKVNFDTCKQGQKGGGGSEGADIWMKDEWADKIENILWFLHAGCMGRDSNEQRTPAPAAEDTIL